MTGGSTPTTLLIFSLALMIAAEPGPPTRQPRRGPHRADFARWGGRWGGVAAFAQGVPSRARQSIWDGVYTTAQAVRGRAAFTTHCAQCHGSNRSLSDDLFMLHWEGHDLARLFRKIKETMPPGAAVSSVGEKEKLDAMTYLLELNGFPPGANELAEDESVLASIRIVPRSGPRPMRTGAIVQVIGCLMQGSENTWLVTNGTEPAATSLEADRESDRQTAMAMPLGSQIFQLLNPFPSPAAHVGHKVQVKGLLIRNPGGDRINVISLETMAPACAP